MKKPFENSVTEHGATVLRVCRALLGPGADADDAWQDTFLAALRAWPTLDEDANVQAWLVRIAQRKCIDLMRTRQRQATPVAELPEGSTGSSPQDGAPDLWLAVAELPERQRLAVAGHYLAGLPHAETAELVGGTAAAVRRACADGVATLRTTYAGTIGGRHDD